MITFPTRHDFFPTRHLVACMALALPAVQAEQNQPAPPRPPPAGHHETGPAAGKGEPMVSRSDRAFLAEAAKLARREVAISEAVLPNLESPEARELARMLIKDRSAANEELERLALRRTVPLPDETKTEKIADKWSDKTKRPDKEYVREVVAGHKDALKLYDEAVKSDDPEIAAFARKMIPMIERHLEMATRKTMPH